MTRQNTPASKHSAASVRFRSTSSRNSNIRSGLTKSRKRSRESTTDSRPGTTTTVELLDLSDVSSTGSSDFEPLDTDEGRLSRCLQQWMPDYTVKDMGYIHKPLREPVFSGRLGRQPRSKRRGSVDSTETQLSLFSCSTKSYHECISPRSLRNRRRKSPSMAASSGFESKWLHLASQKKRGAFDRLAKMQQAMQSSVYVVRGGDQRSYFDSDAFEMMDKDEQIMLLRSAKTRGLHGPEKSGSTTNIANQVTTKQRRVASASCSKSNGKKLNFEELKQQTINRKMAAAAAKSRKSSNSRTSWHTIRSRMSSNSMVGSPDLNGGVMSPSAKVSAATQPEKDHPISIWKGDSQILEMDLKREMSSKVKHRIASTNDALQRATGIGETNQMQTVVGTHEEFPNFTEEDYSYLPRIMQRMRISPALSGIIKQDIKERMGRPRYHEISMQDLAMWNRGQKLDRANRNLKVFTWLHSLMEDDFGDVVQSDVDDNPADPDSTPAVVVHVEAVDEREVKPLYKI